MTKCVASNEGGKAHMKKMLLSILIVVLIGSSSVFADETQDITWGEFMAQHGIMLDEQSKVSYTKLSSDDIVTYSDNGNSTVWVKNVLSNGEAEEYLITGLDLAKDEIQPVYFNANLNARASFLRTFVPSELQNAPILLFVRTELTVHPSNPGYINPRSITFSYSINGNQFVAAPLISCIYDVHGQPIYGNDPEVPANGWFGYNGINVYYQVQCSVASPTAEISYSASKTYPSGHYIAWAYGFGDTLISVSGQISTTSGVKNFSFETWAH